MIGEESETVAGAETRGRNSHQPYGRSFPRKHLVLTALGCSLLLLALWLGFRSFGDSSADTRVASKPESHKIQQGMSYSEVKRIIGQGGHEVNRDRVRGIETAMYLWLNPDGSNVSAIFREGVLTQKAQVGLEQEP